MASRGDSWAILEKAKSPSLLEPLDVTRAALQCLLDSIVHFPETWWHDDPEPGLVEMRERLQELSASARLDEAALLAKAKVDLDVASSEEKARTAFCADLVRAANVVLASCGQTRAFFPFAAPPWDGDNRVIWLLLEPAEAQGLLREKVLKPAKGLS